MRTPDVEAEIALLSAAEGGRQTPAQSGPRPQHKVREDYLTSGMHDYIGVQRSVAGPDSKATITFITPEVYPHCLWVGREIEISEGARVVGRARITKILNPLLEKAS
jgi:translation elongation factor EF-Tu-like GTPase